MNNLNRNESPDNHSRKSQRISDDIKSLDSWTDVTNDNSSSENRIKQELLLNPSRLATIQEPPEPKITRIKLNKADASKKEDFLTSKLALFKMPNNFCSKDGTPDNPIYNDDTVKLKQHSTSASEKNYSNTAHEQSRNCDCDNCMEHRHKSHECIGKNCASTSYLKPSNEHINKPFASKVKHKKDLKSNHKQADDIEQAEKVRNKLIYVWNTVKYGIGWSMTQTNFEKDSPIFLLGHCYHIRPNDERLEQEQRVQFELFKLDFFSRIWFTYRRDFQALPQTKFTTDCGWGCMLRSSQMMLAQALVCHFLGKDWTVHKEAQHQAPYHRQIIKWFGDSISDQCPFSVHRLAEIGKSFGKQPGDWYGPSSVAYILRDALAKASVSQPVLRDVCIYVAQDCTVYMEDILQMCTSRPRTSTSASLEDSFKHEVVTKDGHSVGSSHEDTSQVWYRSVIILIPVRLGGEEFNVIYAPCLKNIMADASCLGMIGGKPKHSLYFIGWQEDKLIYMEPHLCQDFVDILKRDFRTESYHCPTPRKMSLKKIDPSATVGFYCKTQEDFQRFVQHIEQIVAPSQGAGIYPMFVLNSGKGSDVCMADLSISSETITLRHVVTSKNGKVRSSTINSEEFVIL